MAAARDFDSVDASNTTGLGCSDRTSVSLFSYVEPEARVPAKHLLRTISEIVNDVLVWLIAEFERINKARGREQTDRRGACAHARLALEMVVNWFCRSDSKLRTPFETTLFARIHEATFYNLVGQAIVAKARIVKDISNKTAHELKAFSFLLTHQCQSHLRHAIHGLSSAI